MHRPKKTIKSKVAYRNKFYQIRQDDFIKNNDRKGRYYSIITDPFVVMCALTKNRKGVYLVKSWRYPLKRYLWEFPKGWRERNETPLMAAKRELAEELGFKARKWSKAGWFFLAPGITNQRGYVYIAENLSVIKNAKQDEEIVESRPVSIAALKKMIHEGKFIDCASIAAYHLLLKNL